MTDKAQHHHVTLTPKADMVEQTRALLIECAQQVALRKHDNGPSSWCACFDDAKQVFYVEALFPHQDAVNFHQDNIASIVKRFGAFMAAPPQTVVRPVFSLA